MGQPQIQPPHAPFGLGLWQSTLGPAAASRQQRPEALGRVLTPDQVGDLSQVAEVLAGLSRLQLPGAAQDADRCAWIVSALERLGYRELPRSDRGTVLRYLQRLTSYSRAQVSRLVARWLCDEQLHRPRHAPRHAFGTHYDTADLARLAEVDALFGHPAGAVMRELLRRQRDLHGDPQFARLGSLSVSHLYQLRQRQPATDSPCALPASLSPRRGTGVAWPSPADGGPGHLQVHVVSLSWQGGPSRLHLRALDAATHWQALVPLEPLEALEPLEELEPQGPQVDGTTLLARLRAVFPFEPMTFSAPCRADALELALVAALMEALVAALRAAALRVPGMPAPERDDPLHDLLNLHLPRVSGPKAGSLPKTALERLTELPAAQQRLRPAVALAAMKLRALARSDVEAARRVIALG